MMVELEVILRSCSFDFSCISQSGHWRWNRHSWTFLFPDEDSFESQFCGFPLPTFLDERSSISGRVTLLANGHGTLWLQHSRYEVPLRRVVVVIPKLTEFSRFSSLQEVPRPAVHPRAH